MDFKYDKMPTMQPIPIPTKSKGFFGAIWMWLWSSRKWEISKDWVFSIDGEEYIIPEGFVFDGASIPKYFWNWLSPIGVLLMPGLVHDWLYANEAFLQKDRTLGEKKTQKYCDEVFRDAAISVNGFFFINWIAYYALRAFGWVAWNGHRKS